MKKRNWLGVIVLLVVGIIGSVWVYTQTPQFRINTMMTNATKLIRPSDPAVLELVSEQGWDVGNPPSEGLREIYDWVDSHITFFQDNEVAIRVTTDNVIIIFTGEVFRTPADTLANGWGNCQDVAILYATLTKAAGGIARVVLGAYTEDNTKVGYAWSEVYTGTTWRIVDLAAGFDGIVSNRYGAVIWFDNLSWSWC